MRYLFILCSTLIESEWSNLIEQMLMPYGAVERSDPGTVGLRLAVCPDRAVVIMDAEPGGDLALLASVKQSCPQARVLVATASPTWRRARDAFRLGASGYIRKSLDRWSMAAELREALPDIFSTPLSAMLGCGGAYEPEPANHSVCGR